MRTCSGVRCKVRLLLLFFPRADLRRIQESKVQKRIKDDYTRTLNDWHRMNLTELKGLPEQSRFHVKKAIMSYLGTSKGSNKALKPLLDDTTETAQPQSTTA